MKKLKKIISLLLTAVMIFTMSSTVFAATPNTDLAKKATITVNNVPHDANDNNKFSAKAYNIFKVDPSETSGVKFADPFTSLTFSNGKIYNGSSEVTAADLQGMLTSTTATSLNGTLSGTTATFSDADAGTYLVILADDKNTYNPMIAITYTHNDEGYAVSTDATLNAKASGNSLTKTEMENDDHTVSVGDVITYTITTTVPYFTTNATDKEFTITDTLKGASYAFDKEWQVKLGNDVVSSSNAYTAPTSTTELDGSKTFTIDLKDMVTEDNAGKKVTITYQAEVTAADLAANSDAVSNVAESSNTNTSHRTNPKDDKSGSVTIVKEDTNKSALKGAKFILLNKDGKKVAKIDSTNGYYFAGWVDYSESTDYVNSTDYAISASETDKKNSATVHGLAAGTYQFKEIKAPDGYSINNKNVTETITSSVDATSGEVTVTSPTGTMKDTKISSLPSTGGRGTLIFTLIGCAVMIYFASSYMRSKKKSER